MILIFKYLLLFMSSVNLQFTGNYENKTHVFCAFNGYINQTTRNLKYRIVILLILMSILYEKDGDLSKNCMILALGKVKYCIHNRNFKHNYIMLAYLRCFLKHINKFPLINDSSPYLILMNKILFSSINVEVTNLQTRTPVELRFFEWIIVFPVPIVSCTLYK